MGGVKIDLAPDGTRALALTFDDEEEEDWRQDWTRKRKARAARRKEDADGSEDR